jgi:glycosyltransferase involved in cell wall biosynthesis
MVPEREKAGIASTLRAKQITVPIGTVMIEENDSTLEKNPGLVVFMGHLRPGQGIENLLLAMKRVIQDIPDAQLLIIGGGSLEPSLRALTSTLGLQEQVQFTGFIDQFSDMLRLLRGASVAVAPYVDDESTYTRFTDPGKPKDYLASGLPVVITRVPYVAQEIKARRCGLVVDDTPEGLAKAIVRLLKDKDLRQEFRVNALKMAADYTWDQVFDKALARTLS